MAAPTRQGWGGGRRSRPAPGREVTQHVLSCDKDTLRAGAGRARPPRSRARWGTRWGGRTGLQGAHERRAVALRQPRAGGCSPLGAAPSSPWGSLPPHRATPWRDQSLRKADACSPQVTVPPSLLPGRLTSKCSRLSSKPGPLRPLVCCSCLPSQSSSCSHYPGSESVTCHQSASGSLMAPGTQPFAGHMICDSLQPGTVAAQMPAVANALSHSRCPSGSPNRTPGPPTNPQLAAGPWGAQPPLWESVSSCEC